ncbi:MAG TPA: hypothetical protein VHI51_19850, partial [Ktedonobacterales bacterium]|nr:hypothetical protein [Ktedonobacterales bacterium]
MGERGAASAVSTQVAPPASAAAARRLGWVDSLRALAALYVVLSHMVTEVWQYNNPPAGLASALAV